MKLHVSINKWRLIKEAYNGRALCICCGRTQPYRPHCYGCGDSRVFGPSRIYRMMISEIPIPAQPRQKYVPQKRRVA